MLRRFYRTLLLAICCWLLTGPQLLMQLGAWSWMLATYSQESSIQQAFRETFGGERPCDLCEIIESVDDTSTPLQEIAPQQKITLLPVEIPSLAVHALESDTLNWHTKQHRLSSVRNSVPKPPPRA